MTPKDAGENNHLLVKALLLGLLARSDRSSDADEARTVALVLPFSLALSMPYGITFKERVLLTIGRDASHWPLFLCVHVSRVPRTVISV